MLKWVVKVSTVFSPFVTKFWNSQWRDFFLFKTCRLFSLCSVHRLVNIGCRNLKRTEAARTEVQVWIPSQNAFTQVSSLQGIYVPRSVPCFRPHSRKTRSTLQKLPCNDGTNCCKWECSHGLQAISKDVHAEKLQIYLHFLCELGLWRRGFKQVSVVVVLSLWTVPPDHGRTASTLTSALVLRTTAPQNHVQSLNEEGHWNALHVLKPLSREESFLRLIHCAAVYGWREEAFDPSCRLSTRAVCVAVCPIRRFQFARDLFLWTSVVSGYCAWSCVNQATRGHIIKFTVFSEDVCVVYCSCATRRCGEITWVADWWWSTAITSKTSTTPTTCTQYVLPFLTKQLYVRCVIVCGMWCRPRPLLLLKCLLTRRSHFEMAQPVTSDACFNQQKSHPIVVCDTHWKDNWPILGKVCFLCMIFFPRIFAGSRLCAECSCLAGSLHGKHSRAGNQSLPFSLGCAYLMMERSCAVIVVFSPFIVVVLVPVRV